eukprot:Skav203242  [mRNA]  locus=scaffold2746:244266:252420:- [translate_table: standard]
MEITAAAKPECGLTIELNRAAMADESTAVEGHERPMAFECDATPGTLVEFFNHQIELNGNVAIAMGNYDFTSAADGSKTKVEYTFGYKKCKDGKVRIFLHHSSVPFSTQPESVSMEEVKAAQKAWADAIKKISKTYLDGGDYVAPAAKAAGELYGYGHGNVLFKPTKAKDVQFRPEASQAMSYFVGAKAVKQADGIAEDGGFAINGGKCWQDVVFENHQVELNGNVAIAMGNYYFTSAADGSKTKVEYTFGYKKCQDGKVRIFLHHSSVPFNVSAPDAVSMEEVKAAQKAWSDAIKKISKTYVEFFNHQIELNGNVAIAMGNYDFTSAADGSKTKVEYTFGYKKCQDGKVRIFLHHSSVPFSTQPESVSMEEVKAAQKAWADAIKKISKTYLDGGDYVAAAAKAAGELYGYGHGNVLFKPTKAKDVQFRPEASQAMSYFVGAKAVKQADGIAEDGGFAINGGKCWQDVVFENHQVELNGNVAIAMGNYYFTSAADGSKTKVEYTFGYKKCQDGKVRIFLHHSSVPFKAGASEAKTALNQEVGTIGSRIAGS